jgi:hypothetical protein
MAARKTAKRTKRRAVKEPRAVSALNMENVIPAVAGDACPKKLIYGQYVKESCGHDCHKSCCLSCAVQLPSPDITEEHTRTGKHVLARVCPVHGAEEWR